MQSARDVFADAARGAGHDRHFSVEPDHPVPAVLKPRGAARAPDARAAAAGAPARLIRGHRGGVS